MRTISICLFSVLFSMLTACGDEKVTSYRTAADDSHREKGESSVPLVSTDAVVVSLSFKYSTLPAKVQPIKGTWTTDAGQLRGQASRSSPAIATISVLPSKPYVVEADVQFANVITWLRAIVVGQEYLIFDYESPNKFKWASVYPDFVNGQQTVSCAIGVYNGSFVTRVRKQSCASSGSIHRLGVRVDGNTATLELGGTAVTSFTYGATIKSGKVGFATRTDSGFFDNFKLAKSSNNPAS